jgi:hypothetical protein
VHQILLFSRYTCIDQTRIILVKIVPPTYKLVCQVNVGQELLPSLLHTARCFKIKGLDNVQTPPGLLDLNVSLDQL